MSYMLDQASSGAAKVGAAELDVALLRLRDDAPEPLVVYFAAKASDYEGTAGLLGKKPAALAAAFAAAADELRESFSFAWTADPAALAAHGAAPNSVAVLQPPLLGKSETGAVYGGAAEADALAAWVWGASLPLVGELTPRTEPRYAKAGLPLARVALATDWRNDPKGANYHLNRLRKLAAAYAGRLRVAAVKPASPLAALAEFGVDDAAAAAGPAVTVTDAKGKRYAAPAPWSAKDPAATAAFLDSFLGGAVAAHVKSEAVPAGPDNGVTVVVGRTFDDLVTGAVDKDVLVEFYAPARGGTGRTGRRSPPLSRLSFCWSCVRLSLTSPPPRSGAATASRWPPSTRPWRRAWPGFRRW